eukprot:m.131425 g.131425  ORF g.131425 m.131425 type:complete len:191 (-) comp15910_c0_seq1:29-601(-)
MGGSSSQLIDPEDLALYEECTYFTKKEIRKVKLLFNKVIKDTSANAIPKTDILDMPQLRQNPFKERIFHVFAQGNEGMDFDDFLDMVSVFSESAPRDVKAEYAFRIYAFHNEPFLHKKDLTKVLDCLCGKVGSQQDTGSSSLSKAERDTICKNIMKEADLDGDNKISLSEFQHVVSRSPDFVSNFHIRFI